MSKEMNCASLEAFFKSMDSSDLRDLDKKGGLVAWCPNRGFILSVGEPSDRAFHEWIQHDGLISTEIWTPSQELKTKPSELKERLIEDSEVIVCSLEMKLDYQFARNDSGL